jgi:hypothetical protein
MAGYAFGSNPPDELTKLDAAVSPVARRATRVDGRSY